MKFGLVLLYCCQYSFSSLHFPSTSPTTPSLDLAGVLPARRLIPLSLIDDLHYTVKVVYGGQWLQLLLDTVDGDLLVRFCNVARTPGKCFYVAEAKTPHEGRYTFYMDQTYFDVNTEDIVGNISISFNSLGSEHLNQVAKPEMGALLAIWREGVAPGALSREDIGEPAGLIGPKSLSRLLDNVTVFALDLSGGEEGRLWLGGIDEVYRGRLRWGSLNWTKSRGFPISSLEMCGRELLPPKAEDPDDGPFYIVVDTKSACLHLPSRLFNALVSLLPLDCEEQVCTVSERVAVLPTVSFQSVEGDLFLISLTDLILNSPRRLCLYSSPKPATIVLGTRCLHSLFVAFSEDSIGFSNKLPALERSNVQCLAKLQCKGMQEVFGQHNMCVDPPCYNYFFYKLDDIEKVCVYSETFHALAVTLLVLFIAVEFVLRELELYVGGKVTEAFPLSVL